MWTKTCSTTKLKIIKILGQKLTNANINIKMKFESDALTNIYKSVLTKSFNGFDFGENNNCTL